MSPNQYRRAKERTVKKVVFLDRDGVINRDSPDYIKSWAEFEFLPGSLAALALLHRAGYEPILITNQSAINRGIFALPVLEDMHHRMVEAVTAAGGRIRDIFFCPHRPEEGCFCRKPQPGLIHQARARYALDLTASIMIGDSAKDILCGRNAGCGTTILVLTGNGPAAEQELAAAGGSPDIVTGDLLAAASLIVSGQWCR
jgi:D-glycero-D-manno-heptose 1,7-bisphosphate phosphatase